MIQQIPDQQYFTLQIAKEILDAINNISIDSVSVNNLDEVKAHLRNELSKALKPLDDLIKLTEDQNKILKDKKVEVTNFPAYPELNIPEKVTISNFAEVLSKLDYLAQVVQDNLNIAIDAPSVTVNPPNVYVPQITIPQPQVMVNPSVDFSPLIKELNLCLNKIRTNDKGRPLAVRLTDGQDWIRELRNISDQQKTAFAAFSDVSYQKAASGAIINPATDEGTNLEKGALSHSQLSASDVSAQYSNTASVKQLTIQNQGSKIVYIGGSTVSSTNYAFKLVPTQFYEFGKVNLGFNFYYVCASTETSTIGVAKYA